MNKLYQKSELWFAVVWIMVYVIGTSLTDQISEMIHAEKSVSLIFHIILCAVLLFWLGKNSLKQKYGLCKTSVPASKTLFYIPLFLIVSVNLWYGVQMNFSPAETVFYIGSMICVGFLEELIFRGFLFKAMSKDSLKAAVIVSSLTFGIGHMVNLINGSEADLIPTLFQICYACAGGFLFVILFLKTKSLWPCIMAHSAINALSAFTPEITLTQEILTATFLTAAAFLYAVYLIKKLPKTT